MESSFPGEKPSGYRSACTVLMASVRKLRQAEIQLLQTLKENHLYVCGGTIFTEDSDMAKVCCVEPSVNCIAEKFLCTITHVATISSCVCGSFGELVKISDETKRHYQSIHLSAKQMATLNALVGLGLLAENESLVQYEYFSVYVFH